MNDRPKVLKLRSRLKPTEVNTTLPTPTRKEVVAFHLPKGVHPAKLPQLADSIPLEDIGVRIPSRIPKPEFFEAGFRHGLASNKPTRFQFSYRAGFLFAKIFWRKVAPNHRLAATGSIRFKNTSVW